MAQQTPRKIGAWDTTCVSAYERYQGQQGRELEDEVDSDYIMDISKRESFFCRDGRKKFLRHPLNARDQNDTRERYVELLCQHGMLKNVRAAPKTVPTENDSQNWQLQLLSHAHLIEALYLAHERFPDNKQVQKSIDAGIVVDVLYVHTPPDIINYYCDQGNKFNQIAAQTSFLENLSAIPTIEAAFSMMRKESKK